MPILELVLVSMHAGVYRDVRNLTAKPHKCNCNQQLAISSPENANEPLNTLAPKEQSLNHSGKTAQDTIFCITQRGRDQTTMNGCKITDNRRI